MLMRFRAHAKSTEVLGISGRKMDYLIKFVAIANLKRHFLSLFRVV